MDPGTTAGPEPTPLPALSPAPSLHTPGAVAATIPGTPSSAPRQVRGNQLNPISSEEETKPTRRRGRRSNRKGNMPATLRSPKAKPDGESKAAPGAGASSRPSEAELSVAVDMPALPDNVRASLGRAAKRKVTRMRRAKGQPTNTGASLHHAGSTGASTLARGGSGGKSAAAGLLAAGGGPPLGRKRSSRLQGAMSFLKKKFTTQRSITPEPSAGANTSAANLQDRMRKQRAVALALTGATALWEGQQFRAKVLGQASGTTLQAAQKKVIGRFMLHPFGRFTSLWEAAFLCFLFYVTVRVPFFIAFTRTSEWYTLIGDNMSTVFFILDIVVTFRTCYVDEGELVVDPWLVAKHYAHGWLAYDVIASVPYTWLFPSVQAVRLMLLLRLVRLAKLEVVLDRVARKWDIGEIMQLWLRVITLGFYITISGHISGCAWYYIAAKIEDHSDDSWTTLSGIDDLTDMRTKYLTSVYWAFTTLTTVGYGDITAHTQWERGFSVLMLMAGAAVFAMLVGKMSALSTERNARVIELRKRQSMLDEFLRQTNLPKQLRVRVREYSEFLTRKHKFLSEKALLEDLSPALRRAVNRHVNQDILDSVPVFKFGSSAFRTRMAQALSPVLGVKGEFIITAEDVIQEMYFVKVGTVQLINKAGYVLLTLQGGSFFGEIAVLDNQPAKMSVYAVTECELFMLTKEALMDVLQDFPDFETTLRKLAELRNANKVHPKPGDPQIDPPTGFSSWKEVTASSNFDRFYNEQMRQSRQQQAAKYAPAPRRVHSITLPRHLCDMVDIIANHAHDTWAKQKVDAGWKYAGQRSTPHKRHPFLISYRELAEEAKASGRTFAEYLLKYLLMIDYQPVKRVAIDATGQEVQDVATFRWQFGMSVAEEGETFKPRPFPVEHVTLDDGLNRIIEPVAVQLHEHWAKLKLDAGWTWGPRNNDRTKKDSALVPWEYMSEFEREQNRVTVESALKLLVGHGYQFVHNRRALTGTLNFVTVDKPAESGGGSAPTSPVEGGQSESKQSPPPAPQSSNGPTQQASGGAPVPDPMVYERLDQMEAMLSNLASKMDVLLRREYVMRPYDKL